MINPLITSFWHEFEEFSRSNAKTRNRRSYLERSYLDFTSGFKGWHFSLAVSARLNELSCSVYIPADDGLYREFDAKSSELSDEVGRELQWFPNVEKTASRIKTTVEFAIEDRDSWPSAFDWLSTTMESFRTVLGPLSEVATDDSNCILLTWNPERWRPEVGSFKTFLEGENSVAPVVKRWSTGSVSKVPVGTVAFLVRQHDNRGIVASGVTISDSYQGAHWEDSLRSANYVDVKWEISVKTEDRLTIEELQTKCPLIHWNHLFSSGLMLRNEKFADKPPHSTRRLMSAWEEHLRNLGMNRPEPHDQPVISLDLDAEAIDRAVEKSLHDGKALIHGEAPRFTLLTEDAELDALAVYVVAHNSSYPSDPITYEEVEASNLEVVRSLRALGFYVTDNAVGVDEDTPLGRDPESYVRAAKKVKGPLNVSITAQRRREQSLLRGALGLYSNLTAQCEICSKTYPVKFLVAGHIKKRSECSQEEQMDVLNISMPICIFGCDALFEHRYITVKEGRISISLTGSEAADLYLHALEGQTAPGYTTSRAEYFSWHASQPLQK